MSDRARSHHQVVNTELARAEQGLFIDAGRLTAHIVKLKRLVTSYLSPN
jgi:hypothetical protein